ncbi:MAG: permease, partial [Methylocella sp.]
MNWIYTNRRGMMFGVLFGSAFLTLLRYLPRRSFKSGFANSVLGVAIGAPLGVCVNCASPIAAGMYKGGTRAETALAAMIASPTFNIIVVSMAFALLPFYLAAAKLLLTLAIVLVAVPLICRSLPVGQLQASNAEVDSCIVNPIKTGATRHENLAGGVFGFFRDFLQDFWFISRMTVPMMILAGFLGAVVATLVPFEMLTDLPVNIGTIIIVALVGIFAPVPMAFDIVLAAVLLNSGLPISLVMVLLITLGSYSIYSYIVVSQTISSKAAILVAAAIVVTGVIGGFGVEQYRNWKAEQVLETLGGLFEGFSFVSQAQAAEARSPVAFTAERSDSGIALTAVEFSGRSPAGEKLVTRMEAWHRGIDRANK